MANDPEIKQSLAKLTNLMEQFILHSLSGKRNQVNRSDEGKIELTGIEGLSTAIQKLTTDVQGLIRTLGGQPTNVTGPSGQLNANLSPRQLNYDPFTREPAEHFRYGNIPGAINSLIQRNVPSSFATRTDANGDEIRDKSLRGNKSFYGLGAINTALNAVPAVRQEWNNVNAQMQASVDRRITNPTQLGMLAGYQGPGQEGVVSATGSYLSSLFAAPSLLFSGGSNPGLIGNMFGASMSPATQQGWQSQYRAFTRSLNPMDMLSYGQAMGINQAVAGKGFRSLGQQVSVEDAVTQIVQSTAIEAGTAIDTMDLVIKRLHGDVGDANNLLQEFGALAIGAGKNVNQFAQETNQVLAGLSLQGAQGNAALQASAGYSSFTGISGGAMSQFLNGPQLGGLMAAQIMAGGGKFANQEDIMSLAMGYPQAMGGGNASVDVFGQQVESITGLVDTFKKQGYSENIAMQMAASTMGGGADTYYKIQQIYKEGPGIVKGSKAMQGLRDIRSGNLAYLFGNKRRGKLALEGKGLEAFKSVQGMAKGDGIDFDRIDLGDSKYGEGFEEDVQRLYEAKRSKNQAQIDTVIQDIESQGKDVDRVIQAADLLMKQGGAGAQGAWKELAQKYGVSMALESFEKGYGPLTAKRTYKSSEGKMDYKETNAFLKEVTPKLDDLVESGIINKSTEKKWLKMIKDQKMSPDELLKQVAKKESDKRNKDEGNVSIKLTGDAAKYFKLFQGSGPGSDQAWVAPPNSQGYDNRSGG